MNDDKTSEAMRIIAERDKAATEPDIDGISPELNERARRFCVNKSNRQLAELGVHMGTGKQQ